MPVEAIERAIGDACVRLASSAATARRCHEHYLDGLGGLAGRPAWPVGLPIRRAGPGAAGPTR